MMKQIPYGLTDFGRIQKENYYYVDKTMFIEKIEMQPSYLFLIRPRRFGKSLTLAMLEAYYDVRYADQFDELFGNLYIGQHPTPIHNQFLIMRFNFSEVSSNINEVEESFRLHCCGKLKHFLQKYEHILGKEIWNVLNAETLEEPGALLSAINSYATLKGDIKIYLLIDEYDNFTNTILSTYGTDLYRKATHGEGYIRRFFNVIKAATTGMGSAVNRLFITGVSPVTMDDVTSGFNIGTNITTDPWFNDLVGFSEKELREMLTYYKEQGALPMSVDDAVTMMKLLLAYLSMFRYYQLYPEYEMNKGFADFFFKPSPAAPVSPPYTYLLEVKYAKAGASEKEIRALADDAREQLIRYSKDECVAEAREKGGLKLATIVWRSWELVLMEEV